MGNGAAESLPDWERRLRCCGRDTLGLLGMSATTIGGGTTAGGIVREALRDGALGRAGALLGTLGGFSVADEVGRAVGLTAGVGAFFDVLSALSPLASPPIGLPSWAVPFRPPRPPPLPLPDPRPPLAPRVKPLKAEPGSLVRAHLDGTDDGPEELAVEGRR